MAISDIITEKISKELNLDKDKLEIINYGAAAFFHIVISLIIVALFGVFFGLLYNSFSIFYSSLVVSFVSSILRQSSGGVHASKQSTCIIIGTVMTVGIAVAAFYFSKYINNLSAIILGVLSFSWSFYMVYKKAPVDSPAKPINTEAKKKRMRKNSYLALTLYLIFVIILMLFYNINGNKTFIQYSVCIYGAITWQMFTLTIIGHHVLKKIDFLLSVVLLRKE